MTSAPAGAGLGWQNNALSNPPGPPSMLAQLEERRQRLLVELRDVEQAIEALRANPTFDAILQRVLAAHKY